MILSKGIVFIMALFLVAGGLDKIAGNPVLDWDRNLKMVSTPWGRLP